MHTHDIIKETPSSKLQCPNCKSKMKKGDLDTLITCGNCLKTFNLYSEEYSPFFYSYSINPNEIIHYLISKIDELEIESGTINTIKSSAFVNIVNFKNIPVIINIRRPSFIDIQSLIGYLSDKKKFAFLLRFNDFPKEVEEYFKLFGSIFKIISLNKSISQIKNELINFFKKITVIEKESSNIQSIFGKYPKDLLDEEKIISLSYSGGEKFQIPAINLLWPLGVPFPLQKEGYRPDGVIYLPNSVLLIDAKSCNKPYEFNTDARDQISRYLEGLSSYNLQPSSRSMEGIIILTREIEDKAIKRVVKYGEEHNFKGWIRIIEINPLIELYKKT